MTRPLGVTALLASSVIAATLFAQQPSPTPPPTPTARPEMIDLRFIRMKISAGDLPSAESILEVHRAEKGEDGEYLLGLAWLARGAALMEDWPAASRYANAARELAVARLGTPPDWENAAGAQYALGTAIEVEAQALVAAGKKAQALKFLDDTARAQTKAPYNLQARIQKRRNQIELVGQKAPAIRAEDRVGPEFAGLEALSGKPVVLFFWWEACGDCKAQAAAFKPHRREVRAEGRRLRRADTLLRREPRGGEGEDREGVERALRTRGVRPGPDQRRGHAALRRLGDPDVRFRRPQRRRPAVPAVPDDRRTAVGRNRRDPAVEAPPHPALSPRWGERVFVARAFISGRAASPAPAAFPCSRRRSPSSGRCSTRSRGRHRGASASAERARPRCR